MAEMNGSCQCGAVSYTVDGAPDNVVVCHCVDCRKQTASAFALVVVVPEEAFTLKTGDLNTFDSKAASGRAKTGAFCPTCGTRIWHRVESRPGKLSIRGGTLDHPETLEPTAHLWASRKLPWVTIPDGVKVFDGQPG